MRTPVEALAMLIKASNRYQKERTATNKALYFQTLELIKSIDRLPDASYTRLIGVEAFAVALQRDIADNQAHQIHAVKGLPGIGKTSVVDYVVRNKVVQAENAPVAIHWIKLSATRAATWQTLQQPEVAPTEAQQNDLYMRLGSSLGIPDVVKLPRSLQLERIAEVTAQKPHLVVLDNLNARLLAAIQPLAGQTQFVLTIPQADTLMAADKAKLSLHQMGALDEDNSVELVRQESSIQGIVAVNQLSYPDLAPIYSITQGNPLAIKLVVGQLATSGSLDKVLNSLSNTPHDNLPAMYRHIYAQSWRQLSEPEREIMHTMGLVGQEGADRQLLQDLSDLGDADFESAIDGLIVKRLLNVDLSSGIPIYSIHQLTYTFIKEDIASEGV